VRIFTIFLKETIKEDSMELVQWMHILSMQMPMVMENRVNIWSGQKGIWFNFFSERCITVK